MLRPLVGTWFQELFHSSVRSAFHLSFTVLVHYRSLGSIVALPDGPSLQIHAEFLVLRATQDTTRLRLASHTQLSCSMAVLSRIFLLTNFLCHGVVLQPHPCRNMDGLGYSPFARHYWGNHCLFSFPAGTKMFQFPALASCNAG